MSKVEWKKLKDIVWEVSTGLNPRDNFVLNEDGAEYYYVTVKEITTNKIVFSDTTDRITARAKDRINYRSKLQQGDILFSGIGTIGKVAYVDIPTDNWDCSESVFIIKPNYHLINGKFLSYILSSDVAKQQYERGAAGAIMKGVRKNTLVNLYIPIPSHSEQERIVEQLDTFANSIENLKEQIAQRRKQYEYYRDQLLDLEGKEGVEMKRLNEITTIVTDGDHLPPPKSDEGIPFITISNIDNRTKEINFNQTFFVPQEYYEKIKDEKKAFKNDILYTVTGSYGIPVFLKSNKKFCFQRHIGLIRVDSDLCLPKYCYYWLDSIYAKKQADECATGGAQKTVSLKSLRNFKLYLTSKKGQERIIFILDTFKSSIQNLEAQLKLREKQYEYYRNKLLTFE